MNHRNIILLIVICVAGSLIGCAGHDAVVEKPAGELVDDGIRQFNKGNYVKAIEAFEQLKDWYPFSKFAILAELKIADSHFHLAQYTDAIFAYEEFEKLHPRNEAVPYSIYQIGMSYYLQVDSVDRDQTSAEKAITAFERLIRQYPRNTYAQLAQGYRDECIKSVAGHELYVGIYYYRMEHYKAALERFKDLIENYSDVGVHTKALAYIQNCETRLKIKESSDQKKEELYFMPQ